MPPIASWLRAGSAVRGSPLQPLVNTCIFCQQRALTPRLAFSSTSTSRQAGETNGRGTPLHQLDSSKTGGRDKNSPWLQLKRRLREERSEHQKQREALNARQEATMSEAKKDKRRRQKWTQNRDRMTKKDKYKAMLEKKNELETTRTERRRQHRAELKAQDLLDAGSPEIRAERRQQLQEEEAAALRVWQSAIDDALSHVPLPRPATWDGMEMVGGETEWDTGLKYQGYLHNAKLQSKPEITAALYRAIVEVLTAVSHGKDPTTSIEGSAPPAPQIYQDLKDVKITLATDADADADTPAAAGAMKLEFPDEATETSILSSLSSTPASDLEAEEISTSPAIQGPLAALGSQEALDEQIAAWGTAWHSLPLSNPAIKFAIIKRAIRLLGAPIPDHTVTTAHTPSALLKALTRPPAPEKLHEALTAPGTPLPSLPNVALHPRRQTPVDKETAVGRWKVVRSALRAKGLPVLRGVTGWEFEAGEVREREVRAEEGERRLRELRRV